MVRQLWMLRDIHNLDMSLLLCDVVAPDAHPPLLGELTDVLMINKIRLILYISKSPYIKALTKHVAGC